MPRRLWDLPYDINTTPVGHWSAYQLVFMGDNDRSAASKDYLPIVNISGKTASYGNFLIRRLLDPVMHANPNDPSGSKRFGRSAVDRSAPTRYVAQKFFRAHLLLRFLLTR